MLPPKGLLPNGAEEKGDGPGAVAKVDDAVPNGDGFGAGSPIPKGDGVGADDPNADAAEEGAVPKLVAPKGDGFVVATIPNEGGNEVNVTGAAATKLPKVELFVVDAGMKPDDGTPPPAWFEANAPAVPPKPDD